MFDGYIGIDYSGAKAAEASLPGLRVYRADRRSAPVEVPPPPSPRKYWTRRGIASWLEQVLARDVPMIVGIDHGFSFPIEYFHKYGLPPDWDVFLDDFQRHWPTDRQHVYVDFIRDGVLGNGAARMGEARWRRLTEQRVGGAKSVFHFDVQGTVAKSTFAGLPWLRQIRRAVGHMVHFWPFDGWDVSPGRSVVAEVYPSLWRASFPPGDRTPDQHDAYTVAAWLQQADARNTLAPCFTPDLSPEERKVAAFEGWILGGM